MKVTRLGFPVRRSLRGKLLPPTMLVRRRLRRCLSKKNQKTTSQGTFKDFQKPLAWHHFPGDPESGVSFRALIYIPSRLSEEFFNKPLDNSAKDVRLLLFPQADQANYFTTSHPALKLAASEDSKNRQKLAALVRFNTNQREVVSFDSYLENRKQGQKQIFYLADMGKSIEHLSQSVFVEKLHARGYEHPELEDVARLDRTLEMVNPHQREGLRYSHPHTDTPEEKDTIAELTDKYAPLLEWLKIEAGDNVKNDSMGFTANIQKLMNAFQLMTWQCWFKLGKNLQMANSEAQLKEVASILIDGALVRSGFEVADSNLFLTRVDRVLRRSLGVSETAPTDDTVKPAPPVDPELPSDIPVDDEKMFFNLPDEIKNNQIELEMEDIDEDGNVVHDEL
ncbi:uncharacterized protein F5891DRAFT_1211131 [Suillus fuscotomentosus]|uniref:Uncharacterized protein n=1 Tax=Suillus fuscotomentosus TaxID=1912939 RepID=A0AAD4DRL1_9AGAM|nr:uncharacterized protein F5891DRAFT_1211131 [Suillus fuscotomentosus]KAG1891667.1 hypothetical protein F5891DRAFT_1211131 [Suillus fuscotomentosus]